MLGTNERKLGENNNLLLGLCAPHRHRGISSLLQPDRSEATLLDLSVTLYTTIRIRTTVRSAPAFRFSKSSRMPSTYDKWAALDLRCSIITSRLWTHLCIFVDSISSLCCSITELAIKLARFERAAIARRCLISSCERQRTVKDSIKTT